MEGNAARDVPSTPRPLLLGHSTRNSRHARAFREALNRSSVVLWSEPPDYSGGRDELPDAVANRWATRDTTSLRGHHHHRGDCADRTRVHGARSKGLNAFVSPSRAVEPNRGVGSEPRSSARPPWVVASHRMVVTNEGGGPLRLCRGP